MEANSIRPRRRLQIPFALQVEVILSSDTLDKLTVIGTVKVASLQKNGQVNIIRPSWLLDCVKQNEVDAGLSDFLLPMEPRYVYQIHDQPCSFAADISFSQSATKKKKPDLTSTNIWIATLGT